MSWTLGADVENLTLTGAIGINGTGNALDNVLTGNIGANVLTGGSGNDTLNGAAGADTMVGGAGNDAYTVDNAGDVFTEAANEGTDLVNVSFTYTLAGNLENLTLTGSAAINATGNALDNVLIGNTGANVLTGNAGNDVLNGGAGADTMLGGAGDDVYVVNDAGDVTTELSGAGTDVVESSITWALGANFENLTLTGASAVNGTGNTLGSALTGNGGTNVLVGAAGNDTLDGAAGTDTLIGGTGADVYKFGAGYGVDTVQENDATANTTDAVQFVGSVTQANVQFNHVGNNLEVLLNGTSDKLVVQNWYLGSQYHVEEFRFTDNTVLLDSQVQGLVSARASFSTPSVGVESIMHGRYHHMMMGHLANPAVA